MFAKKGMVWLETGTVGTCFNNEKNESIDSPLELELFFIKALELIQEE